MRDAAKIEQLKQLLPQGLLPDQVRIGRHLARALAQRRQGHAPALPLDRWLAEAKVSVELRHQRLGVRRHVNYPPELPITGSKDALVAAIRQSPVVVVAGETGSGKTTQLPKMCLEAGLGVRARVGCTQPRRLAAVSVSRRLAEELELTWGREVGCKIRFSDHVRPESSVKVMTDGILLAEVQSDPELTEYEALIIDEAHERSLNIDFLLGYLQRLRRRREDLKVIITSATIDTERFSRAFDHAPVIEVSGRMYPVEVRWRPFDTGEEEQGEVTYVDAAVNAVDDLLADSTSGDLLVFMPSERDIRETCDRLATGHRGRLEVVPLFGRLSVAEQQQVFAPSVRRRAVVATNIAETSLTVPRIRYVVDTGLARLSRYHPGTRSKRLPVEPISQSSARQRAGRCGRVSAGVCVRLYAEADFRERPLHTEPEIQRANLADVILRMKAFHLGEMEDFPFLDPPSPQAIGGAYQLLEELGALDEQRSLTACGRDLARLPVDPAIGRMILEAKHENALKEVLVIAAGLSIQDPRERPFEQKDAAEAMHRRFHHPRSDFLALLNIWQAYHDTWESLKTQSQLRKFCRAHFLSFVRMREWVDVHAQLEEILGDLGGFEPNSQPADYAPVHRSILTGLWGHVGKRKERNLYEVAGGRAVAVFPGSGLCEKGPVREGKPPLGKLAAEPPPATAGTLPEWIVAGEIVETSRTYARTVAAIDPAWVIELAPHLCRHTYLEPRWDRAGGRVLATERISLRGLALRERRVAYGRIQPAEATEIFIRAALVGEDLPKAYPFLEHNRHLREKIELWQTRLPHRVVHDLDQALYEFYAPRVPTATSTDDLDRLLAARGADCLCATERDLLGEQAQAFAAADFPDTVQVAGRPVPVVYAYAPGQPHDGVTLRLAVPLAQMVDAQALDWTVPVLREERLRHLLRLLPKPLRRPLMPLDATARAIAQGVVAEGKTYLAAVSAFARATYGVEIPLSAWPVAELPPHLRPRFEIVNSAGKPLLAGRALEELRVALDQHETPAEQAAWQQAVERWERYGVSRWDFGELPAQSLVSEVAGFPWYAYPGLQVENGEVNLRLFRRQQEARDASREGVRRLAELALQREFAWLQKDLRALERAWQYLATLGPAAEVLEDAWENLRHQLLAEPPLPPVTAADFAGYLERIRARMPALAPRFMAGLLAVLKKRHEVALCRRPYPELRRDLETLAPRHFLRWMPLTRLEHLPRYLQALLVRAERASVNPAKDLEKQARVRPYLERLRALEANPPALPAAREKLEHYRWLVEEFKVACFAQELGTATSVSPKKLDEALADLVME